MTSFDTSRNLKRYYDPEVYRHTLVHTEDKPTDLDNNNEKTTQDEPELVDIPNNNTDTSQDLSREDDNEATADQSNPMLDDDQNKTNTIPISPKQDNLSKPKERSLFVNKILKQRFKNRKRQYLLEWTEDIYKPSWQNEEDVSPELKRLFHLTHTRTGKRRKRQPYQYFKKSTVESQNTSSQ